MHARKPKKYIPVYVYKTGSLLCLIFTNFSIHFLADFISDYFSTSGDHISGSICKIHKY